MRKRYVSVAWRNLSYISEEFSLKAYLPKIDPFNYFVYFCEVMIHYKCLMGKEKLMPLRF